MYRKNETSYYTLRRLLVKMSRKHDAVRRPVSAGRSEIRTWSLDRRTRLFKRLQYASQYCSSAS